MATSTPPRTTFAESAETLSAAINSFFSGTPSATLSDLSKLFHPSFIQRDDETSRDFPAFVAHITWLREILPPGAVNIRVTHFLKEGNQIAERHSGDPFRLEDGRLQFGETFMWIELAEDGRIEKIVETIKRWTEEVGDV